MILPRLLLGKIRPGIVFEKSLEKAMRGELGNIVHIPLGYQCNNNCIHCGFRTRRHLERSTPEILALLHEHRKSYNLLMITGGEPTIRIDLSDVLTFARRLSYEWIQLQTNGRMFSYQEYTRHIVTLLRDNPVSNTYRELYHPEGYNFGNLGICEFRIQLVSHIDEVHDAVTGVVGSFAQTVKGIRNLLSFDQSVTVHIPLLRQNYRQLHETTQFVRSLGVTSIDIDFVDSTAAPRLHEVQKLLHQLILRPATNGRMGTRDMVISNIPFCIARDTMMYQAAALYPYDQHRMYLQVGFDENADYQALTIIQKTKGDECRMCRYDTICCGLWRQYAATHGFEELSLEDVDATATDLFSDPSPFPSMRIGSEEIDLTGLNADAIVHLSGGIDSTLAAMLYARAHPSEKIVLITYDNVPPRIDAAQIATAQLLLKQCPNIITHRVIRIPEVISYRCVYADLEKIYQEIGYYVTCEFCKALRFTYAILILKKYLKGSTIVTGLRGSEGCFASTNELLDQFLESYSITCTSLPESTKQDVYTQIRTLGIDSEALFGPHGPIQAECWTHLIKSRFINRRVKDRVKALFREKLLECRAFLELNGVSSETRE
jgi:MoaA/NifB/PqqE/SkfB family radical SAM enzyme